MGYTTVRVWPSCHRVGQVNGSSSPTEEIAMCYPVTCPVCGKITWDGCGQHVDAVKASVPAEQWCGGQHAAAK
jgi:hypothetical protein